MHIFFIDDSSQGKPTRPKMGRMVAIGGLVVASDHVHPLEAQIEVLCSDHGFPPNEVFKWSPGREHWMRTNLKHNARRDFQIAVLKALAEHECKTVFVAEDAGCSPAESSSTTPEIDIVKLSIERVDWFLSQAQSHGVIICDRPGGDHRTEESFLLSCLETLREGTGCLIPDRIMMSVLTCPFRLSRILQAADLITSCTLAYVAGESNFAPALFPHLSPLFIQERERTGGVGVKLHPFKKYGNLYHRLFGDKYYVWGSTGHPLPLKGIAFSKSPDEY
jgi:hypothetical protein